MKHLKIIALLALVSLGLPLQAEVVPEKKAAETAAAFFGTAKLRGSSLRAVAPAEAKAPAFRAYNRDGGGFVVISGNDAVEPVLAYSDEGTFPAVEDMPENMAWWFGLITKMIEAIPESAKADAAVKARWANPGIPKGEDAMLLETAIWGQGTPFNDKCPEVGGQRCVTGCVATAAAIVARYHRWPDAGEGTVPGYHVYGAGFGPHDLGYAYDWDNMPLSYNGGYNDAQADAVSTLMYDMGTISQMQYGVGGSGAYTSNLLFGLRTYMKYNKGAYLAYREDYSDTEWTALMKQQLAVCGPVAYSGYDINDKGGHQFVIDGYDAQNRFHFNWGWYGGGNCYCWFTSLVPEYSEYDFASGQDAIVNLVPDKDGTSTYTDVLVYYRIDEPPYGIETSTTTFRRGKKFSCAAGWIYPLAVEFDGVGVFALYDKYGNFKEDISDPQRLLIYYGKAAALTGVECTIKGRMLPGDRIKMRYVGLYNEGIISAGAGCVTEVIVMPEDSADAAAGYSAAQTAEVTSLSYDRATGVLSLSSLHSVHWFLVDSGGNDLDSGSAAPGQRADISLASLASGTYTVEVGSYEDPFIFTIIK